ncbi:MAG TPA: DnaJ domain-containing protein [bacterium]|nr:DnaJ domain-containing protein [bacterium]
MASRARLDHYRAVLGVARGASAEELKQSYRDLVKVWHPDRFLDDPRLAAKASEKLKEINEAWEALSAKASGAPAPAASPADAPDDGAASPLIDFLDQLRRR